MTLAATDLLQHNSGGGHGTGTSTTASFTPADNSILAVACYVMIDSGVTDPSGSITITDSAGLTWTRQCFIGSPIAWSIGCAIWTAPVTTGASMTLTFDCGAENVYSYMASVRNYTGYGAVGATAAEVGDGVPSGTLAITGADSITLSSSPAITSEIFGILGVDPDAAISNDPDALCTTIQVFDVGGCGCSTQYRAPGSTSTAFGWDDTTPGFGSYKVVAAAIEITEAGAAPAPIPQSKRPVARSTMGLR